MQGDVFYAADDLQPVTIFEKGDIEKNCVSVWLME